MKFTRQNKLITLSVFSVLVITIIGFYLFSTSKQNQEISDSKAVKSDSISSQKNNPVKMKIMESTSVDTIFEELEPIEFIGKEFSLNDTVVIIPKKIVPEDPESCEIDYSWEEIKLPKTKLTEIINKKIKEYVNYALENCQGTENPCSGCNFFGKVYYLSSDQIGISLASSQPVGWGIIHNKGNLHFKTSNGEIINFRNLLKPELVSEFDTLLFRNLQSKYNITADSHYLDQFQDLNFLFDPNGIEFTLYNYRGNYTVETNIARKDIEPFLKDGFPTGKFRE